MYIGTLPKELSLLHTLNSIEENILIASPSFDLIWMNHHSSLLFSEFVELFGLTSVEDFIGLNMNHFHKNPAHQERIMKELKDPHRARITIGHIVTDTIITPIRGDNEECQGYMVMLMDVTTRAEEEEKKEKLLHSLEVPMIQIWDGTIALPLIGEINQERADHLISKVLNKCVQSNISYVLMDVSGLYGFQENAAEHLQKLHNALRLMGTTCVLVGITPKLAMSMGGTGLKIKTFTDAYAGLRHILAQTVR